MVKLCFIPLLKYCAKKQKIQIFFRIMILINYYFIDYKTLTKIPFKKKSGTFIPEFLGR